MAGLLRLAAPAGGWFSLSALTIAPVP